MTAIDPDPTRATGLARPGRCSAEECARGTHSRGLCKSHYERLRRGVEVNAPMRRGLRGVPLTERLAIRTEVLPTGCHRWLGVLNSSGYGTIKHEGGTLSAHRVAFDHAARLHSSSAYDRLDGKRQGLKVVEDWLRSYDSEAKP